MKKTILFMSMAAAFLFAGCQKEQSAKTLTLTASIEQQQEANKTYLNGGYVLWSKDDAINVFTDDSENVKFTLKSGVGSTSGSFANDPLVTVTGDPTYAIYPYAEGNTISGSTITFNLPATQKYVENTFDNGANVAVAQVTNSGMKFKNVCGVLKLQLTGYGKVTKIELTGNNDEYLWGTYTADANTASSNAAIYSTGGGKTLTLDCSSYGESSEGAGDGGVRLNMIKPIAFYFVVPVGVFGNETKGGFTATVISDNVNISYAALKTEDKSNVINRSGIRIMNPKGMCFILPSEYQNLSYIESTKTQYISTTWIPESNGAEINFCAEATGSLAGSAICGVEPRVTPYINWLFTLYREYKENYMQPFNGTERGYPEYNINFPVNTKTDILWQYYNLKNSIIVNGEPYYSFLGSSSEDITKSTEPQNLFCNTLTQKSAIKLYYYIIKESTDYKRAFVPAKVTVAGTTDIKGNEVAINTVGLYEVIKGKFYTNDGTGEFIAGPEITE